MLILNLLTLQHKNSSRYSEDFVLQLEKELVQARLSEAESQCALKEMQDKVLEMEKARQTRILFHWICLITTTCNYLGLLGFLYNVIFFKKNVAMPCPSS